MDSVPENFWRLAERHKITAHSAQSMHERFRKKLRGYTPSQVAHALKLASGDSDLSSEIEEEYVSVTPIKREKRSISPPRDNKRDENTYSSAESDNDSLQSKVRRKRPDRKRTIESTENSSRESSPSSKTVDITKTRMKYPPVLKKLGQLSSKEQEKMLEQPELRRLLQAAHHLLIENESKKSKKIEATKSKTPTPMKPIERPKRPFAEREVIERVEADSGSIGNIIRQIQFESKQDINAVIHALFYASGDIEMATAFLKGGGHKGKEAKAHWRVLRIHSQICGLLKKTNFYCENTEKQRPKRFLMRDKMVIYQTSPKALKPSQCVLSIC
ncbi:unnamed protein product [Albugo candida]|uniref:Uncharacterized protein n=3 Tax=Albugo candida TaxID=65357 RepID=A0A024GV65_9STRA|nr:unnamed protein product [Albugo candida]|eukprot:CCI50894.1 unnamed protein product [Albugo candida]